MSFLLKHDIITLTETFVPVDFESSIFKDYLIYTSPAKKLSNKSTSRYSGGVIVLVKKLFEPFVKEIKNEADNTVVLRINKNLFNTSKDIMFISSYVPPHDSPYWTVKNDGFGLEILEQCILDLQTSSNDFFLLLTGDFNARTACKNYSTVDEHDLINVPTFHETGFLRKSQDGCTNAFGNQLVELCNIFDCIILNGLCDLQFDDSYTFIGQSGSSVIDYFIISFGLFGSIDISSLDIENLTESDHLPVTVQFHYKHDDSNYTANNIPRSGSVTGKYIWDATKKEIFVDALHSIDIQNKLALGSDMLENDIEGALNIFVCCLKDASSSMFRKTYKNNGKRKKSEWFDEECSIVKKQTRQKLNVFRATRKEEDRLLFVEHRKKYRQLLRTKQSEFRKQKTDYLANNVSNSTEFWKEIRLMGCGNTEKIGSNISTDRWFSHFKDVFQNSADNDEHININVDLLDNEDNILNLDITEKEVTEAIAQLKPGKACGIDDITVDMLKNGGKDVHAFMVKLFNAIFQSGIYPKEWSKAIIIPVYKKGDPEKVDNYRGISLLSIISKCYTKILNSRLYAWLENNHMISDSQAGFRKGYSTVDQIFNLYSIVQKCMHMKGRKLYVAFVDFKKAFDSVRHDKLLQCLISQGVRGKFLASLKSMYESLLSCVRTNCEFSDVFECPVGVRQGCVLSPTLFSMFINQLADHMDVNGKDGVEMLPDIMELFILLFADDVALLSTSANGLQNQLDVLHLCCDNMKLTVNIDKTKIMVFRKGGHLGRQEKWFFGGKRLDVVNDYCYLGFNFTTKLSTKRGTEHLATKGKKGFFQLNKVLLKYKEMSSIAFFKIFDAKIQPMMLYSSEIWGLHTLDHLEKVHMLACKRFLGVPIKTPNKMVYGDLGRYPLHIISCVNVLRYWFRLLHMDKERLTYKAYQMLLDLDMSGKHCWVSKIREILCFTGFNFVWLHQGVGNVKLFLREFKQKLIDFFIQEWSGSIRDSNRFDSYRTFKTVFEKDKYISDMNERCFRVAISQFRFNELPLNNNLYRYSEVNQFKMCPFCKNQIEDEHHFLIICSFYTDLRIRFLKDSASLPMHVLFDASNDTLRYNLSRYIFHAIRMRMNAII